MNLLLTPFFLFLPPWHEGTPETNYWSWRWDVFVVLTLLALFYLWGWRRLQTKRKANRTHYWQLISYIAGLLLLAIALLSPIDGLSDQFFFMHMIQHLILVMIVPPLLHLANPFPVFSWALPKAARQPLISLFKQKSTGRTFLQKITALGPIAILFNLILIGWHDPDAYGATLTSSLVHDLEHLSFFLIAMLFWWHVVGSAPHIHKRLSYIWRIPYVLSAAPTNMMLGIILAFAEQPYYAHYTEVTRTIWPSIDATLDQTLGGVIMWIPGTMMYLVAALILLSRLFKDEENK